MTGSRAEYGLLRPLLRLIREDERFTLQLVVTGAHLSPEFGLTYREIEADGFSIDRRIEMLLSSDTPVGTAKAMGLAEIGFADAFAELAPSLVIVLGDRFEILAATSVALVQRIPVAHIHGGEITEGAFDDSIRHAITKMSHLHFTATEGYRRRVIQMGEDPRRVIRTGALGLDAIRTLPLLDRPALEAELGLALRRPVFLVTYHPATLESIPAETSFRAVLESFVDYPEAQIVFTRANADDQGRSINAMIDQYVARHPGQAAVFTSLGQMKYLSLMQCSSVVIGNSSSGIIEAPSLHLPTVNVGTRQRGRERARTVIDVPSDRDAISAAILTSLSASFAAVVREAVNPYGDGHAAGRILECIGATDVGSLIVKSFHDSAGGEPDRIHG